MTLAAFPVSSFNTFSEAFANQPDHVYNQANDLGYEVALVKGVAHRKRLRRLTTESPPGFANGALSNWEDSTRGLKFPLFITDVSIDIALSGKTAQSQWNREFYPHNFVQPNLTIKGICLDQLDYGALCNYVHHTQRRMIGAGGRDLPLVQLDIFGKGLQATDAETRTADNQTYGDARGVSWDPGLSGGKATYFPNLGLRGPSHPIQAQGYVLKMPQIYNRGKFVPTYQFDFVVAYMLDDLYKDVDVINTAQKNTWVDMLMKTKMDEQTFGNDGKPTAIVKEADKFVTWAKANSQNIFNAPANAPGGGSINSTTSGTPKGGVQFNDSQSSDTSGVTAIDDDGVTPSPTNSPDHQSSTSYQDGHLGWHTNYFALNPGWASANGLVLGDVGVLTYKGKSVFAVYGDNHVGNTPHAEISVGACMALTGTSDPAQASNSISGVHFTIYPNTHQMLNGSVNQADIDRVGHQVSGI